MGFVVKSDTSRLPTAVDIDLGDGDFAYAARYGGQRFEVSHNGEMIAKISAQRTMRAHEAGKEGNYAAAKAIVFNPLNDI